MNGIIYCLNHADIIEAVDMVLKDPAREYSKRSLAIERNLQNVQKYRRYADWFLKQYGVMLEEMIND
jgi:hypothetical protein